jgi:hypothetical protein
MMKIYCTLLALYLSFERSTAFVVHPKALAIKFQSFQTLLNSSPFDSYLGKLNSPGGPTPGQNQPDTPGPAGSFQQPQQPPPSPAVQYPNLSSITPPSNYFANVPKERVYYDPPSAGVSLKNAPQVPNTSSQMTNIGKASPFNADSKGSPKKSIYNTTPILVQGSSLRTWSFATPIIERVVVKLGTEGRPLTANIELWHGPDNTPQKFRVYTENGAMRPVRVMMETPRGYNSIAIRNTGHLEFPLTASLEAEMGNPYLDIPGQAFRTVQGGALVTYPFEPTVESVKVLIKTDGRPLNARIELLQGPNNNKQVIEVYSEDGLERPFFCVIETPGSGNVVRVVNTAPVEFPMSAIVEANSYESYKDGGPPSGEYFILDQW